MIGYHRMAAGFTLIELMISLTIGATVTGAGLTLYAQMSKSRNLIQAELNLQSNSYLIHQTLRQFFNQAGYRPLDDTSLTVPILPVKALEQSFEAVSGEWALGEFVRATEDGLAFRFEGSSNAAGVADGSLINCHGDAIAAGDVAEVEFTVVDEALLCTSDDVSVELISDNDDIRVEQMVVNWGVDTNNDFGIDEYRTDSTTIASNEQLMAVRLSLLLSSREEVHKQEATYRFDGIDYTTTDSRLRRESVTTIQLKH